MDDWHQRTQLPDLRGYRYVSCRLPGWVLLQGNVPWWCSSFELVLSCLSTKADQCEGLAGTRCAERQSMRVRLETIMAFQHRLFHAQDIESCWASEVGSTYLLVRAESLTKANQLENRHPPGFSVARLSLDPSYHSQVHAQVDGERDDRRGL